MSVFSAANIARALERVPSSSTKNLRNLLKRSTEEGISKLSEAITEELNIRGSIELDEPSAQQHADWAKRAANLDMTDAILLAFKEAPIADCELNLMRKIAQNPGIGYQALVDFRGKGDVGLILGHIIYDRLGFFRKFLNDSVRMSDILFQRDDSTGHVRYFLKAEAENSLRTLELI